MGELLCRAMIRNDAMVVLLRIIVEEFKLNTIDGGGRMKSAIEL
jgi:hypothetical protein